jgi:hypothetical protein
MKFKNEIRQFMEKTVKETIKEIIRNHLKKKKVKYLDNA